MRTDDVLNVKSAPANFPAESYILAEPAREGCQRSTIAKQLGNLSIREILVVTPAYVRPPARTDSGGRGRGVPRQPDGGWRMPSFLGGKSRGAFGQPVFFLAGNLKKVFFFKA